MIALYTLNKEKTRKRIETYRHEVIQKNRKKGKTNHLLKKKKELTND